MLQGSAATHWRYHRYGGKYMDFVGNSLLFPEVKKFWKSVKNWQSYRNEFGVLLFWDSVYASSMATLHSEMQFKNLQSSVIQLLSKTVLHFGIVSNQFTLKSEIFLAVK